VTTGISQFFWTGKLADDQRLVEGCVNGKGREATEREEREERGQVLFRVARVAYYPVSKNSVSLFSCLRRRFAQCSVEGLAAKQPSPVELETHPSEIHHADPVLQAVPAKGEQGIGFPMVEAKRFVVDAPLKEAKVEQQPPQFGKRDVTKKHG
jgi:hypothetical protein